MPDLFTPDSFQAPRRAALQKIFEKWHIVPGDDYSGAEDARDYLDGSIHISRFCALSIAAGNETFIYAHAEHDTLESAQEHLAKVWNDPDWSESPRRIIDLDTGAEWIPTITVTWHPVVKE